MMIMLHTKHTNDLHTKNYISCCHQPYVNRDTNSCWCGNETEPLNHFFYQPSFPNGRIYNMINPYGRIFSLALYT